MKKRITQQQITFTLHHDYNHNRPHSSLRYQSPAEHLANYCPPEVRVA